MNPSPIAREYLEQGHSTTCPIIDMHGHLGPFYGCYLPSSSLERMRHRSATLRRAADRLLAPLGPGLRCRARQCPDGGGDSRAPGRIPGILGDQSELSGDDGERPALLPSENRLRRPQVLAGLSSGAGQLAEVRAGPGIRQRSRVARPGAYLRRKSVRCSGDARRGRRSAIRRRVS